MAPTAAPRVSETQGRTTAFEVVLEWVERAGLRAGNKSLPGSVTVTRHGAVNVIALNGEHDLGTAEAVRQAVIESVRNGTGIVVSLVDAQFIDSTVIGALHHGQVLLSGQDRALVLHVTPSSLVYRTIEIANVGEAITCTPELERALVLATPIPREIGSSSEQRVD